MHVKSNDQVVVLAGKDRGKTGKVARVLNKQDRVVVEKLNMVKRHTKPTERNRSGGIIDQEAPLDVSNVALYCNQCGKGVRAKMRFIGEGGVGFVTKQEAQASFPEGSTKRVRKVRSCHVCGHYFD